MRNTWEEKLIDYASDHKSQDPLFIAEHLTKQKHSYTALIAPLADMADRKSETNFPVSSVNPVWLSIFSPLIHAMITKEIIVHQKILNILFAYTGFSFKIEFPDEADEPFAVLHADLRLKNVLSIALSDFSNKNLVEAAAYADVGADRLEFKSSGFYFPLKNSDIYKKMEEKLPGRGDEINDFFEKAEIKVQSIIENLNKKAQALESSIGTITLEDLVDLQELIIFTRKSLIVLLFLPHGSNLKKETVKAHLRTFIKILHSFYSKVLHCGLEIGYPLTFTASMISYVSIEEIYVLNELAQNFFNIRLNLINDRDVCFALIKLGITVMEQNKGHGDQELQVNDFERLLLSYRESIPRDSNKKNKDNLTYVGYIAFCIYFASGNLSAAMSQYEASRKDLFKLLLNTIISDGEMGFSSKFFDNIFKTLVYARDHQLDSPQKISEKTEELIQFLFRYIHKTENTYSSAHAQEYVNHIIFRYSFLAGQLREFKKNCLSAQKQRRQSMPDISSENKPRTRRQSLPPTHVEYKLIEDKLIPPKEWQAVPALIPPATTVTVSEEEIRKKKDLNRKKGHKRRNSMVKSKTPPKDNQADSKEIKGDDVSPVFEILNPLTTSFIYAYFNFGKAGKKISEGMQAYLIESLSKGKLGLGPGKLKLVKTTEQKELNNPDLCWKIKGRFQKERVTAYGFWDKSKRLQFGIFDFNPHHGSPDKLSRRKSVDINSTGLGM